MCFLSAKEGQGLADDGKERSYIGSVMGNLCRIPRLRGSMIIEQVVLALWKVFG